MKASTQKFSRPPELINNHLMAGTSEWLTATEAAAYLKVKPRSLLLWVRQGKVRAYALSGTRRRVWRFRPQDLDASLKLNSVYNPDPPAVLTENRRTQ